MNSYTLYFIIISLVMGLLTYLSSSSILMTIVITLFSIIFLIFISRPICNKYYLKSKRFHECYNFINNFIISLSVKDSIESSISSTIENMNSSFKKDIEGIEHLTGLDKLTYISKYFKFDIYNLFLNIISLYEEQGGNILQMSQLLSEQSRYEEEYLNKSHQTSKNKIIEFMTLWLFTLAIPIALKFVLGKFYTSIFSNFIFQILIAMLFVLVIISIHLLIVRITKVEIKGWENEF